MDVNRSTAPRPDQIKGLQYGQRIAYKFTPSKGGGFHTIKILDDKTGILPGLKRLIENIKFRWHGYTVFGRHESLEISNTAKIEAGTITKQSDLEVEERHDTIDQSKKFQTRQATIQIFCNVLKPEIEAKRAEAQARAKALGETITDYITRQIDLKVFEKDQGGITHRFLDDLPKSHVKISIETTNALNILATSSKAPDDEFHMKLGAIIQKECETNKDLENFLKTRRESK